MCIRDRNTTDPYLIWISEIILQQTRVAQGYEYFLRFIKRFPDVVSLAAASEDEVMKYWQGLEMCIRDSNNCERIAVLWAASTEIYIPLSKEHESLAALEQAMKEKMCIRDRAGTMRTMPSPLFSRKFSCRESKM